MLSKDQYCKLLILEIMAFVDSAMSRTIVKVHFYQAMLKLMQLVIVWERCSFSKKICMVLKMLKSKNVFVFFCSNVCILV